MQLASSITLNPHFLIWMSDLWRCSGALVVNPLVWPSSGWRWLFLGGLCRLPLSVAPLHCLPVWQKAMTHSLSSAVPGPHRARSSSLALMAFSLPLLLYWIVSVPSFINSTGHFRILPQTPTFRSNKGYATETRLPVTFTAATTPAPANFRTNHPISDGHEWLLGDAESGKHWHQACGTGASLGQWECLKFVTWLRSFTLTVYDALRLSRQSNWNLFLNALQ